MMTCKSSEDRTVKLAICRAGTGLFDDAGRRFDAWQWRWVAAPEAAGELEKVAPRDALRQMLAGQKVRAVPVGVIGPKEASAAQLETAQALGREIALLGLAVLTGGKSGVMEAASRGAFEAGGLTLGLLPDEDWHAANPYVTVPLATGIGPARNALIARAAMALIAVGGEHGTLSEMALGLHFGKCVFALCGAPPVAGAVVCQDIDDVLERLAATLLHLD